MTPSPHESHERTERTVVDAAREHVGAAGFAQRDALERIIIAGREQILFTQSLREVITTTLEQLHTLPLMDLHHAAQPHIATLENIVQSCQAQLNTADELRELVRQALTDVRGTAVEHISAHLLTNLSQLVHRQAADLQGLITLAINEASTVQQITTLERVSARAQAQLLRDERERTEQELVQLDRSGQDALTRIRTLEEGGVTHATQKAQLQHEAMVTKRYIARLEADAARDVEELTQMEEHGQASRVLTAELEASARQTQARIARLRQQLELQHRREHESRRQPVQDAPGEPSSQEQR